MKTIKPRNSNCLKSNRRTGRVRFITLLGQNDMNKRQYLKNKIEISWLIVALITPFLSFILLKYLPIPLNIVSFIVLFVALTTFAYIKISNTKCPSCGKPLNVGYGINTLEGFIVPKKCMHCGHELSGS